MKYLRATRPAFLSITAVGVFAGAAHAWAGGATPAAATLLLVLAGAMLAHAGANVLNDLHDGRNGSDAANTDRVAPFTGGSRFIQDGIIAATAMHRLAWGLLAGAAASGLVLLALTDARLLVYGVAGLGLAAAYSAPPLALMARGLGELAVGAAWALVVAGTDFVLSGEVHPAIAWVAIPFGVQVMLVLLVNQVPDFRADAAVGKRNWVVRFGRRRAAGMYAVLLGAAYGVLATGVAAGGLPRWAAICLPLLPVQSLAVAAIARHHAQPAHLRKAIVLTLFSAHLFGLALALSLIADRLTRA